MKLILVCCLLLVAVYPNQGYQGLLISQATSRYCRCSSGQFCRVFRQCDSSKAYEMKCVSCVTEGIDDYCRANGFYRAVLNGKSNDMSSVTTMSCRVGKGDCPAESFCAGLPGATSDGICCYNPIAGRDRQCPGSC